MKDTNDIHQKIRQETIKICKNNLKIKVNVKNNKTNVVRRKK